MSCNRRKTLLHVELHRTRLYKLFRGSAHPIDPEDTGFLTLALAFFFVYSRSKISCYTAVHKLEGHFTLLRLRQDMAWSSQGVVQFVLYSEHFKDMLISLRARKKTKEKSVCSVL